MSVMAVYCPDQLMSSSLINMAVVACYVVFFLHSIEYAGHWFSTLLMRQIGHASIYNVLLVVFCGLRDQYGYCSDIATLRMSHSLLADLQSPRPVTFNGDGTQATGELRVLAALRKWPLWRCGTPYSPVHEVPPVNCVLARPCRFGTPIELSEPLV